MILKDKVFKLLNEMPDLQKCGVRVVGSQCTNVLSECDNITHSTDVDIHIVIKDFTELGKYSSFLQLPKNLDFSDYNVIATKIQYLNELFSIHIFTIETYSSICSLSEQKIRMLRTSKGKTKFESYGIHKNIPFSITISSQSNMSYVVNYLHQPIINGHIFVQPYTSMALSGVTLKDDCNIDLTRIKLIKLIIQHLILEENVVKITDFIKVFGKHVTNINYDELSNYKKMFIDEISNGKINV